VKIKKIVSGGQTGVDSAALDAALEFGIPIGGWVPKGRRNEYNEIIKSDYNIQETPSVDVNQRTEWNVRDSDATLIIYRMVLKGGTDHTVQSAINNKKPYLLIDLSHLSVLDAKQRVSVWLSTINGTILNIAGPRDSEDNSIYCDAKELITSILRQNCNG